MNAIRLLLSLLGNNATGGNLLGSLLKKLTGGKTTEETKPKSGGGLGAILGGLLGGGKSSGGAGGILGGLLGGGLLGSLLGGGKDTVAPAMATPEATDEATLLIRAMCNAAKADGEVDQQEQQNILGRLGEEVDQAEIDFVRSELESPLDVAGFAASVPSSLAANVYAVSLMAIKVDTPEEAEYLRQLAAGMNLDRETVHEIHQELGLA